MSVQHKFVIAGRPITKKNSQRLVLAGKFPKIVPSAAYTQYEKDAGWFLKPLGIDYPVNVACAYFMPTRGKVDLVNLLSATCDILVKHGVISDDNSQIVASHDGSVVLYDKENPRVEIAITGAT